jgi:hypothetical protein
MKLSNMNNQERKIAMMTNPYTQQVLMKQRQQEMLEQAEQDRLVNQILRWLKQEDQKETESTIEMKTPEVSIYKN